DEAGKIDEGLYRAAADIGLLALTTPHALGGTDMGQELVSAVLLEVARGSASFAMSLMGTLSAVEALAQLADETARGDLIEGLISGRLVGSIALTEPGAGTDLRSMRTIARACPEGFKISGEKTFITNAGLSDVYVVLTHEEGLD